MINLFEEAKILNEAIRLHIINKEKTAFLCGRKKGKGYSWEERKLAIHSEYDVCFGCLKKLELQEMSMSQVQSLDSRLDALFSRLGIDVVFSNHFVERLAGREDSIEPDEVYEAFVKFLRKYGDKVYMSKELSGVLKDLSDDINIPFSIKMTNRGKKLHTIRKFIYGN